MNTKITGILLISVGVLSLLGIGYFIFYKNFYVAGDPVSQQKNDKIQSEKDKINDFYKLPIKKDGDEEIVISPIVKKKIVINSQDQEKKKVIDNTEADILRIAASFSERFGSYSNQSNFSNVSDLKLFMTDKMKIWADNFIIENLEKNKDISVYYGVTSKAISEEIININKDLGYATVRVSTLRKESAQTSSTNPSFYQDIEINLKKERNVWLVDEANWK